MTNRAASVCWAVLPDGPGRWRKQLLFSQDPTPLAAVDTAKTEAGADDIIDALAAKLEEREAFEARQVPLFEMTAAGDVVDPRGEAGAAKALAAAPAAWRQSVWRWISAAKPGARLTSDEAIAACGMPPDHPHAVGAVFKNAAATGLIAKTGDYVPGARESCNGAVIAVWLRTEEAGR